MLLSIKGLSDTSADTVKYDNENNLLCYLYLWNKTFLNAHLIKYGFVDVDTALDYKYKID